jgi:hypothetical protein
MEWVAFHLVKDKLYDCGVGFVEVRKVGEIPRANVVTTGRLCPP